MLRSPVFLFLVVSLLITSCGDKEIQPSISYPSAYYRSDAVQGKGFRVYARNGEIRDKAIVNKYLAADSGQLNYDYRYLAKYFLDSVKFIRPDEGRMSYSNCTVTAENGLIVFTQKDTLNRCCSSGDVLTRTFEYNGLQVKPNVFTEEIYSSIRGYYYFTYFAQSKYVLMKYEGKLSAPVTQYIKHSHLYRDRRYINNLLVPDFFKYLEEGDTLALMTSFITFEPVKQ